MSQRKIPPIMLPQNKIGYKKFKQSKWRKPFPPEYKKPAQALMLYENENVAMDSTLNPTISNSNASMYKLAMIGVQRGAEITYLIKKCHINAANRFKLLDNYIIRILIAEMIWGAQNLKSSSDLVEAVKFYEEDLREAYIEVRDVILNPIDKGQLKLPTYIRINTLSISIEDTLHAFCKEGWNLLPRCSKYSEYLSILGKLGEKDFIRDYHISELLAFPPGTALYDHPGYLKGKFLFQDKGSCLSSFLLNPKPDSVVFDSCAAPGKKTNHLANIMGNKGLIYANDINPERLKHLNQLMELTDVKCAKPLELDFVNIDSSEYADVKYILVDPSCSYSGIFYQVGQRIKRFGIQKKQFTISMILRYALQTFPNVKRVVYTTCSLYPEEGEMVIDDALKDVGDSYTLLNVKEMLWNEWDSMSQPGYTCQGKCLRVVPEYDLCQGYFIAVFERNFDIPVPPYVTKYKKGAHVYTSDEMEVVEKVNRFGKIIESYVPKDQKRKRLQDFSKLSNKLKYVSKQYKNQQHQMKYVNPKLKNATATANPSAPEEIYETTHSQLYP